MKKIRFLPCLAIAALAVPAVLSTQAHAKDYPVKPVKIVVPFAAGGGADQLARLIALHWQTTLGTPVIVDNKTGGNTVIAAEYVARAEPDGYTLLLTTALPWRLPQACTPAFPTMHKNPSHRLARSPRYHFS